MFALTNCNIYTGSQQLELGYAVVVNGDKIHSICRIEQLDNSITQYNLNGANLAPGFIDLQLNGCGGVMFNDDISVDTLKTMHQANLKSGCTSFLPTLITSLDEDMIKAINVQQEFTHLYPSQSLGVHIEGPYLNRDKKGIHNETYIRLPDNRMIDYICENSESVAKVTLAPEITSTDIISRLANKGIVVAIGHSNATYTQAITGFNAGISFATHLFNAMSAFTSREPGVVGAIYDCDNIYAGIIADGFHVDYASIRISKKIKRDKLILVTDATAPAGAQIDSFNFVGKEIKYQDGKCIGEDGTLGGSALTMNKAIKNTVEHVGIELDEALRMATLYPARAIGVDDKLGKIEQGYIANLAIFDHDLTILATVVNGQYELN